MTLVDLLTTVVLAYVGAQLAQAAWSAARRGSDSWDLVRGLRPRHFALGGVTIAAVLAVAFALLQVPGLDLGWWTALGGLGNPVVGATDTTRGTVLAVAVPVVFVALLVVGLPVLVVREEWIFRRGAQHRTLLANARWALAFGLAHALVGIPIGAALALSIGGASLTAAYVRTWRRNGSQEAALAESARTHLAYNLLIIGLVAGAALWAL